MISRNEQGNQIEKTKSRSKTEKDKKPGNPPVSGSELVLTAEVRKVIGGTLERARMGQNGQKTVLMMKEYGRWRGCRVDLELQKS